MNTFKTILPGRRAILGLTLGLGAGMAAATAAQAAGTAGAQGAKNAAKPARPNILYIMSDDHGSQAISCYGGILAKVIPTPNIDRIAKEGVRLEDCFVTNSISTPSRAAIVTGQYSQHNGVYSLDERFDPARPNVAKELQKAGYHTALIGKWHLTSEPMGFDYYNVLPGQGRYFDPVFIEKGHLDGADFEHAKGTVYKGHVTDVTADLALDWLSKQKADEPFFLMCHFKAPHRNWEPAPRFDNFLKDTYIPEPKTILDTYEGREWLDDLIIKLEDMNPKDVAQPKIPTGLSRDSLRHWVYQYFMKQYLRCVAGIDESVGRILTYLDQNGLADNTIVIYTSDQGFFLGEHGLFDKRLMHDESIKMPFLVRYPGHIKAGTVNHDIALNIDFAPTFLDYAGAPIPSWMDGTSMRPILEGHTPATWRKSFYYRYWMNNDMWTKAPAHYGIRTDRYKLVFLYGLPLGMFASSPMDKPFTPRWEFYDLLKDPTEMHNRYGDPAYAKIIADLKTQLLALKKQYGDEDSRFPEMEALVKKYW